MFRIWYWYISRIDADNEIVFMNYGYDDPNENIILDPEDESNRYSIQLYHRLAAATELKDKHILEVGCGRGGGLAYVKKTFSPSIAVGMDLEDKAVKFANKHHISEGLDFVQGDAHSLPFENNSFDAVLNVESSHRYQDMDLFLSEVSRVLKPDGYFLYTDFRFPSEMADLKRSLDLTDFKLIEEQNINANVTGALFKDSLRRKNLVKKLIPRFMQKTALNFAGVIDSDTYNQISAKNWLYYVYIYQKTGAKIT